MWAALVDLLCFWGTCLGFGSFLVQNVLRRAAGPGPLPPSFVMLTGVAGLAALLPALFLVGTPKVAALASAFAAALIGLWQCRHVVAPPTWRTSAWSLLLLVPLSGALVLAATRPLIETDAIVQWWPKVEEVAAGRWPELHELTLEHFNPSYPRGMAWLVHVAWPFGPTPATLQLVGWSTVGLSALAMAAFTRERGHPGIGLALAFGYVLLPDVVRWASAGYADSTVGAATLLAAIGLAPVGAMRPRHGLAMVGAVGAAAVKEEGNLVLFVVGITLLADVLRRRASWHRLAGCAAFGLLLVPFQIAKAGTPPTRLEAVWTLLCDPDLLLLRFAATVRQMATVIVETPSCIGFGVLAGIALLLPRGWPRPLPPWVALVALPVVSGVYVGSNHGLVWHVASTFDRVLLQMLPTVALAAGCRLLPHPRPAPEAQQPG